MLTTYSPTSVNGSAGRARYILPHPICIAVSRPGHMVAALSIHRPSDCRHPRMPLWWFSLPHPDSPRLSAAARLAVSSGTGISPTQWIAMGLEATKEAI
jgi:hypothetical protein